MRGTLKWLERIPPPQRDIAHVDAIVPQVIEMKQQIDNIGKRISGIEEKFESFKIEEFDELKKDRQLYIPKRVFDNLPIDVKKIIESIRNAFYRGIPEFCPTFMRKALEAAIHIRFKRDNIEDKLYNSNGERYRLPKMLEIAKQEKYLSSYLFKQLRREVRVFGDVLTHDYKIEIDEEEIIPLFKLLRLALDHIYHENNK